MNFVEYITELLRDAGRLTGFLASPEKDMAEHGFGTKTLADAREAMSLARVGADDDMAFRRLDAGFARRFGVLAGNDADVANISDGSASMRSGDINVRGATGPNVIDQSQNVGRGGINTGDQRARIDNDTNVNANTGGNTVIGNASRNTNIVDQDAAAIGGRGGRGGAGAVNQADVANVSDGSASLRTGNINVSGASGPNVIDQSTNVGPGGINTGDQTAIIDNDTNVTANTGGNTVIGNASRNTNIVDQDALALGGRGRGAGAVNQANVGNVSDGTASAVTGDINVRGATGPNVIDQTQNVGRGGINTGDQTAIIDNDVNVRANTGGNTVIGNASRNTNIVDQDAASLGGRGGAGAVNQANVSNVSDGTASLRTGDINVRGASGPNVIDQTQNVGRGGINTGDQTARIDNDVNVRANTGGNTVIGNASRNTNIVDQDAASLGGRGGAGAVNQANVSNVSDGTANVRTGSVNVSGASGPNVIDQSQNVGRGGINTGDQRAAIDNDVNVRANTGGNTVIGNASRNTNVVDQDAVSLGNRVAPAATAAAAGVYGVEGELDDGGQPTALFNKGFDIDPSANVNESGHAEANTSGNLPQSAMPTEGLLGHGQGHGGMTPANAPLDGTIDGGLPGGPGTPLWDPGMGTTPTPPADPAPMPSPSGHPSPMPSPAGMPDDTYQHSPLSPAPGGQSHSGGVDGAVDAALARVDGQVDGLHAGYGAGGADHFDGTQLAQAPLVDDEEDWGGSSVPAPEPSPPITHGGGTGALVDDDDDWGSGAHGGSADPSPAPSPMPSPDPAPSPHSSPSPMPSPAPSDDGLDDFDSFDKRNEHAMDHDDDVMDHDDFDDIG